MILRSVFGEVEKEFRFHPVRQWRFDYVIPAIKVAFEYNGHGSTGKTKDKDGKDHIGRHATIAGMSNDCEKLNAAQIMGWTVIQFTAFHFRASDRIKHKLTSPLDTAQQIRNNLSH